ncbi:hypothetical protein HF673_19670 [Acidithiobacillus thiooxidans]|uniref:Uncharacterized protein n=1 Tax=Acidithiobacillus sulfurivorans TaxID=1958756 RepID=A0ABS6A134_9PROT|nr:MULTISPECIES: hypothetical protein [Acidithiobacillus]MBU2760971.1 hypothetical protein [Acidithiobacillus sulfurivorans]MBU2837879.1 hypothetical protein [Acidithiobacillus thiooxidans]
MPELENDWMVLTTINTPRRELVNGDDVESWLRDTTVQQDTMGLQTFFYECDLGAQLGFLEARDIPVEQALATLDKYVRPWFPNGYHFLLDDWKVA